MSQEKATEKTTAWAAWHPTHGFEIPHFYEGAIAFADLDGAGRLVRYLNEVDLTTNRTGWRAVKAELVKVKA